MSSDLRAYPCRIFGVAASAAPIVLLLRRGPTRWVQLVQWQTDTDTFVDGQWMRGRVYERRCSLSPDGQLFVYFVSKITPRTIEDKTTTYAWTAVSRPPYFTALALWPKGDCWNGGGVLQDNHTLLLNHPVQGKQKQLRLKNRLRLVVGQGIPWFTHGEDEPLYSAILQQQGWKLIQSAEYADYREQLRQQFSSQNRRPGLQLVATKPAIWQKPQVNGRFLLQQTVYGVDFNQYGSPYVLDWEIINTAANQAQRIEQAEWAGWDQQGRLIFTRQGQVWACASERYPQEATCLLDLNNRRPDPHLSPGRARKWP